MAVTLLQLTLGAAATQASAATIKARWIVFVNNAAAAIVLGDSTVSSTHGIILQPGGNNFAPPMGEQAMVHYLNQWYAIGTNTQILDVIYDSVA